MLKLKIDTETYSELDITKVGGFKYTAHKSTRPLCLSYKIDDEPTQLWDIRAGETVPPDLYEAAIACSSGLGVLPAMCACGVMRLIGGCLPKHLFVFIFGHGYVAGVLSVIVPAVCLMIWHQAFWPPEMGLSMDLVDWFVTLVILSFTEGSLSGMLLAVFVIYRPDWVPRFSDQEYLKDQSTKMP